VDPLFWNTVRVTFESTQQEVGGDVWEVMDWGTSAPFAGADAEAAYFWLSARDETEEVIQAVFTIESCFPIHEALWGVYLDPLSLILNVELAPLPPPGREGDFEPFAAESFVLRVGERGRTALSESPRVNREVFIEISAWISRQLEVLGRRPEPPAPGFRSLLEFN